MEVHLLTGSINSGKTTRLAAWCTTRKGVAGLLSPKLEQGRSFQNIRTGEYLKMEAEPDEPEVMTVGRYTFSRAVFNRANETLVDEARNPQTEWLIIDEAGPLELRGEGLDPALQQLFTASNPAIDPGIKVVLVIREGLVEQVKEFYDLSRFPIFQMEI